MELLSEACREVHGNEYLRPVLGAALVMGAPPLVTRQLMSLIQHARWVALAMHMPPCFLPWQSYCANLHELSFAPATA